MRAKLIVVTFWSFLLFGCSPAHYIARSAKKDILKQPALSAAHVGITLFEPATNKYWYNYQGNKYFTPASNTKIITCYAAMKYLGKYLPGLRYQIKEDTVFVQPTGDPTFLHPDFSNQRAYGFLSNIDKHIVLNITNWQDERWGSGWAWDDYNEPYMAEKSAMPVYGNVVQFDSSLKSLQVIPDYFSTAVWSDSTANENTYPFMVQREIAANRFSIKKVSDKDTVQQVPFYTENSAIIYKLLTDTLHKIVRKESAAHSFTQAAVIHSQPTDSLLKPMLFRSDNFFAEQSLLMVSSELLGIMNTSKVIDTLLKTDFKDLPQKPRWTDGSGLSRYNLFTPQDFVIILNKMKTEFGMNRIKQILPTGGQGTLSNYYKNDSGYVYAKTGSFSGVVTLSGFLYTQKNKLLIFSILVNNHQSSATSIRKSIESFLEDVRRKF